MPTEAYAHGGLCPLIKGAPHVTEKGYIYPHTLAYFNHIEQWLSPLNSFWLGFAPTTTFMIDKILAVALNKHEYLTSKKLGKLIADIVPHNSRHCCYCYPTKSAKAKST